MAFLVSLTKLSELGTSLDPALYGAIARSFARNGKWWSLGASENLFPQFYEHPFLVLWLNGLLFKVFGASDYTSRILGILFGTGSFYWLYRIGEMLMNARFASVFCFLTLFSVHFTGRFPSLYLDVPLVFFMLGSLFFTLKSLSDRTLSSGAWAGAFLGFAFLTKGLAALPALALIGATALYRERLKAFRLSASWACLGVAVAIPVVFCLLQRAFGQYDFVGNYLRISLFQKTLNPGAGMFPPGFFYKILQTHPAHVLMALAAPWVVWKRPGLRDPFFIGAMATGIFLFSQGSLHSLNLHYFYPIYPMMNLLAAVGIYPLVEKFATFSFEKFAFRVALFYLILWHALPLSMRKKGFVDFFQLQPHARTIKAAGIARLEAVNISATDWIYRDLSLWYWDLDSKMVGTAAEASGKAIVVGRNADLEAALSRRGYQYCAGAPRYAFWVADPALARACQHAAMSESIIR